MNLAWLATPEKSKEHPNLRILPFPKNPQDALGNLRYCRFDLVCLGKKFGERNFFWAWYKMKLICLLYFHFVPSPKKFLSPIFFPRQTKWNRQYAGGKEGFSKFSLMLKTRYCRFHLLWPSENLGERKNFWSWYKSKTICVLYFRFVPSPEKFSPAPIFPEGQS